MSKIRWVLFLVSVLVPNAVMNAQHADPFFAKTQFAQWAVQGALEQIPWKLRVGSAGLSVHQRIVSYCAIDVDGRYFKQKRNSGDLIALVQFRDSTGHVYQDHRVEFLDSRIPALGGVLFNWRAFVLPGEYIMTLAVYDTATGKHSFTRRELHIEPLSKDPLPEAWRDLPSVEFLQLNSREPDSDFRPEAASRLHLPLRTKRPIRVELMANLTAQTTASHSAYESNLASLLPIVKTFSEFSVGNGVLNVELLDLARREVAFHQDDVHALDWPRLRAAVMRAEPSAVDVSALEDMKHTARFFREEVAQRIAGTGPQDAIPVIVLISSSVFFDDLDDSDDAVLPRACRCVAHYIRYDAAAVSNRLADGDFDNVRKVLKPLALRTHIAESPQDLRRLLAEIMDEISKL